MIHIVLISLSLSFASIPKHSTIHKALKGSTKEKLSYFKKDKKSLRKLAFSNKESFKYRWSAFSTLMKLGKDKKDLLRALKSEDWFMRDLGLKIAKEDFPKEALFWSRKLIKDPSLIVRTTAVKNIDFFADLKSLDTLWEELYSKQNYRNQNSLWVRRHIVRALGKIAKKDTVNKNKWSKRLAKTLLDKDTRLHSEAIFALTSWYPKGPKLDTRESLALRKQKWLNWTNRSL